MTVQGVLVVGYGNPLRTDDGIGWRASEVVAADPRLARVAVRSVHQLLPELALDVSLASLVVLIDARVGRAAGSLAVEPVEPATSGRTTWSHHLGPAALGGMAHELYGRVPPMFVVSVGVASLEPGEGLSAVLEGALPRIADTVVGLVAAHDSGSMRPSSVLAGVAHA